MLHRAIPLACLLALSVACSDSSEADLAGRPSVIFISIDTLSARHMSLYGYERETTPAIDAFATGAVLFEQAWANAPWTVPSYMSQFTGLHAAAFQKPVEGVPEEWAWTLPLEHTTMAERFRDAGYRTAAFVDNPNLLESRGFAQGFETYDTSAVELGSDLQHGGIQHVSKLGLEWLDQGDSDQPALLFLQALDVHGPYLSGGDFDGHFRDVPSSMPDPVVPLALTDHVSFGAVPLYISGPVVEPGQTHIQSSILVDDYDESIRALDAALAKLFDELETRGLFENAIVIISADHGESLVEHRSYFSHFLTHGELLHVPLIVKMPGQSAGRKVTENVQLVDLLPTLLEFADLPDPGSLHGRSLIPAIQGRRDTGTPAVAFSAFQDTRAIVMDHWKLIVSDPTLKNSKLVGYVTSPRTQAWLADAFPISKGKTFGTAELPFEVLGEINLEALAARAEQELAGPFFELYHIAKDPGELDNLAEQFPERVANMLAVLEVQSKLARNAYLPPTAGAAVDPDAQDALEKIGYMGDL